MLRQIATRDVVVLDDLGGSPRRLAALTYIAVQYGFRYEETNRLGQTLQVRLTRDPRPEARERSTAALGRLAAGRAPGMRPGTLKPLPDVAPAVGLLKARIEFDALSDDLDWRRKAVFMTASAALMALLLIPAGWRGLARRERHHGRGVRALPASGGVTEGPAGPAAALGGADLSDPPEEESSA
ncbi:hypothetical protein ACRJ4B_33785 [Streptomyces sp. GTA36]